MQEFFAGRTLPKMKVEAKVEEPKIPEQKFEATTHEVSAPKEMSAAEKGKLTKAANAAAKAKEAEMAAKIETPKASVPTTAYAEAPKVALNPLPSLPEGMPKPSGMPNYGAPAIAPVAPPTAWNKDAVVLGIQQACGNSAQPRNVIESIFGSIFQEQGIAPGPVGQLSDQDLYKFQAAFYPKIAMYSPQAGQHLV